MITKQNFGNVEDVVIVEFGNGTLSVCNGHGENHKSLFIKQKEFSPIGEKGEPTKNTDEFKPEVALVFKNKESFDVFYEYVENVRKEFESET